MDSPFHLLDPARAVLGGASPVETVSAYHQRTKHHLHRYAAGPGYLDWASQPDPFRRFRGTAFTSLPLGASSVETPYEAMYAPGSVAPRPLDLTHIGAFFELSLGLSAWKRAGETRWALRCNPSSGNLHPTEGYLMVNGIAAVPDGVHHYAPREHGLEHRCAAALPLPPGAFLVGLTSIHWREAWKYGERAFRYCQHDVGHAMAALRYAGAALGWTARLLDAPGDADIAALLGLEWDEDFRDAEPEAPDALILVSTVAGAPALNLDALVRAARDGEWTGKANRLSESHVDWSVIEEASHSAAKPRTSEREPAVLPVETPPFSEPLPLAYCVLQNRRSAQTFDGHTGLTAEAFFRMAGRLIPRPGIAPWDALPWEPLVHPVFMVHRVQGVTPGLYAMARSSDALERLKDAMSPHFLWREVWKRSGTALCLLQEGDAREASKTISCQQDIASDGAFTLGMLADFEGILNERGAWWYRRLFWEAGVLGQALYLEAEASGVRGTGIGCYFDDVLHGVLGLEGRAFQDLYHFTVGMPVEDARLETDPPYAHLRR